MLHHYTVHIWLQRSKPRFSGPNPTATAQIVAKAFERKQKKRRKRIHILPTTRTHTFKTTVPGLFGPERVRRGVVEYVSFFHPANCMKMLINFIGRMDLEPSGGARKSNASLHGTGCLADILLPAWLVVVVVVPSVHHFPAAHGSGDCRCSAAQPCRQACVLEPAVQCLVRARTPRSLKTSLPRVERESERERVGGNGREGLKIAHFYRFGIGIRGTAGRRSAVPRAGSP